MAVTYAYVCRVCGTHVEYDQLLAKDTRHIKDGTVCGTLRRDYSSVNVNRSNLRKAR